MSVFGAVQAHQQLLPAQVRVAPPRFGLVLAVAMQDPRVRETLTLELKSPDEHIHLLGNTPNLMNGDGFSQSGDLILISFLHHCADCWRGLLAPTLGLASNIRE